ncbi:DHA2 family efflux MFS transporter permease subunit [Jiangella aurantiaca]|uniref:DHA2 family efflux MFS transporter permease subunit n=1 Tax=Jiangella aurantiaca TaxID=2530373 RepID=A0A4R4ZZ12_9ACTN|nr:MFS transporter [Jiangella aurantiaca]TDD64541.1 DHA2 family efflux MFS transporter permease subunit [Jiangella aurantiaca]
MSSQQGDRPPTPGSVDPPDPRRWKALALLGTAFFMVILDATIVLTAIPSIQDDLDLDVAGVQWVLTGYVITFGGLMLFFGRVADLVGRRGVFLAGVALFVVSSLLCGIAWDGWVLLAARAVQGVSAAIMAPTALSIVVSVFRDPAERNQALGVWGALGGIGATAGLLLGGVITSGISWEWIFYINVPIGVAIFLLVPALINETKQRVAVRKFDAAGAISITAALVLLIYAIINAPEVGWGSTGTIFQLAAAAVLIALFLVIESRSSAPLVPLRIFKIRNLTAGNLTILAVGLTVDGMLFPLTIYVQEVLDYSALQFGLTSAVMTVMSIVGAFAGQAAVTRLGLRPIAVPALLLIAVGTALLITVSADGTFWADLFWGLLIFGPGMGAAFVASQIAALDGVAEEESGLAAGLVDTSFNIGSALGIAIVTSVALSVAGDATTDDPKVALTEGLQSAFLVATVFAVLGLLAAFLLPGKTPDPARADADAEATLAPMND